MRILFVISVHGHGRGGHFHSLYHISKELSRNCEVQIVSIGSGRSDILEGTPFFKAHLDVSVWNFIQFSEELKKLFRGVDVIHFFDYGSYNVSSLSLQGLKKKVFVSKCGGPIVNHFPFAKNIVLFSEEDRDWFGGSDKFNSSNVFLIPNRVSKVELLDNTDSIVELEGFTFVRICRIGKTYEKSIRDSYNLLRVFQESSEHKINLVVIGRVEESDIYDSLRKAPPDNTLFLTDNIYTVQASKMLHMADGVIGTGRGLMEASSLGIPVLAIDSMGDLPVLLHNEELWLQALKTNFSQRNKFKSKQLHGNLDRIRELISDQNFYNTMSKNTEALFDAHLNLADVNLKYLAAYNSVEPSTFNYSDIRIIDILRSLYQFQRSR